jgi:hypothetical protein
MGKGPRLGPRKPWRIPTGWTHKAQVTQWLCGRSDARYHGVNLVEAAMKTFMFLGFAALLLAGCTDTIVMRGANGRQDVCEYSLMYRSLHQCVASAEQDGMTLSNGPAWWTFYR